MSSISLSTAVPDAGTSWTLAGSTGSLLGGINIPLSLPVGSVVPQISAIVQDSSSNVTCMMLVSLPFTVLNQVNSDSTGASQRLSFTPTHVVGNESLAIRFTTPASTSPSTISGVQLGTSVPSTEYPFSVLSGIASSPNVSLDGFNGNRYLASSSTSDYVTVGISGFPVGFVIDAVKFLINKPGSSSTSVSVLKTPGFGSSTLLATSSFTTPGANKVLLALAPEVVSSDTSYWVTWRPSGGNNAGETFAGFSVLGHPAS